jgi:hypothetical protein
MKPIFAIDVGGVLANKHHEGEPMAGSLQAVQQLAERFELWVVSQCGKTRANNTKVWLAEQGFLIPLQRQVYVSFKEEKLPVLRSLGASYFVDDRGKHVVPALHCKTIKTVFHLAPEPLYEQRSRYKHVTSWDDLMLQL